MEVSAKNAWGKKNCLTPAFLAHTGFFFKISNYQCPLVSTKRKKEKNGVRSIPQAIVGTIQTKGFFFSVNIKDV